jgi:glycosyltransferase involved in cell wall biosynthesis
VNKLSDDSPQWLKELIIANYKRANEFIAVSGFVRDEMVAHGADPGKITVIPNGVDATLFTPASKEAAREQIQLSPHSLLVLFTGSLTPRKGVNILLRAFQPLAQQNPQAKLVLVGEGPERGNLLQLAKQLGVADRVVFAGAKPHPDLPAWYQACDIYVLPSWAEGLSLALLEAMASGKPVITTAPALGNHDAVRPGQTGLLFERGKADELAQLLSSLAVEPDRQHSLGQAARRRVEADFTWESVAQRTLSVYNKLLKTGGPTR